MADLVLPDRPTVVLDTNVYFQAMIRPAGPARRLLDALALGKGVNLICNALLAEFSEVCMRPKLASKFAITRERLGAYLAHVRRFSKTMKDVGDVFVFKRDPKDAFIVNLAVTGKADVLVSRDLDLLELRNGDDADAQQLRDLAPNLVIVDPVRLLNRLDDAD
ncbi:MAG: putative toxin-antitoxin system toxin component, PIN family [Planctomycetota bacterium]